MNDPILGQILVTDSMLTVTRPRQVVVHKIAETYLFGEDFKRGFNGQYRFTRILMLKILVFYCVKNERIVIFENFSN